jgi:hypothetical protein
MKDLAILNTTIATTDGVYEINSITLENAKALLIDDYKGKYASFVGHQSTADIMSALLGVEIKANRGMFEQEVGQDALVFKLDGRPAEGKILTADEIEEIGYSFKTMTRVE